MPILPKLMPAKVFCHTVFGCWCCYSSDSHLPVLSTQQSLVLHHQDWRWKHLGHTDLKHPVYVNHALLPAFKETVYSWCFHQCKWGWLVILASPLGINMWNSTPRCPQKLLLFLLQCVWTFGSFQSESLLLQTLMNNCFLTIRQHLWSMLGFKLDSLYGVRRLSVIYVTCTSMYSR